jgi:hypothetical protein
MLIVHPAPAEKFNQLGVQQWLTSIEHIQHSQQPTGGNFAVAGFAHHHTNHLFAPEWNQDSATLRDVRRGLGRQVIKYNRQWYRKCDL